MTSLWLGSRQLRRLGLRIQAYVEPLGLAGHTQTDCGVSLSSPVTDTVTGEDVKAGGAGDIPMFTQNL